MEPFAFRLVTHPPFLLRHHTTFGHFLQEYLHSTNFNLNADLGDHSLNESCLYSIDGLVKVLHGFKFISG